jgi:hypothetical protein
MNYQEEARYIESIPFNKVGGAYCGDPKVFARYVTMQRNGARAANDWKSANDIAVVLCNLQVYIVRMAMIDYMAWNDPNGEWQNLRENQDELTTPQLARELYEMLMED